MKEFKLAILDLYDNTPNQGMRCIKEIVKQFEENYTWKVYDVRGASEVPDLSYDIYISSGGPGSPHDGDGVWDVNYFEWLDKVWKWNQNGHGPKKHVFFICHSYQMACKYFKIGQVIKRKSRSFGTFPVHMTNEGVGESIFSGLENPFYAADFRDFQVIQPDEDKFEELGANLLALEKIRPHVPLERAIMGIRFSEEIMGVQFHPEADPSGMIEHFKDPDRQNQVIKEHGKNKLDEMINHLNDEDKISKTHNVILPNFIKLSLSSLSKN